MKGFSVYPCILHMCTYVGNYYHFLFKPDAVTVVLFQLLSIFANKEVVGNEITGVDVSDVDMVILT